MMVAIDADWTIKQVYTQLRARRLGLPAPSWRTYVPFVKNNKRSAPSSYEPARGTGNGFVGAVKGVFGAGNTGYSGANTRSARTREALDPDQAWDSRIVDEEDISYNGGGYGQRIHDSRGRYGEAHQMQENHGYEEPERGRSRSRDPPRHNVPPYPVGGDSTNPFAGDIRRPESEGFVGNNVKGGRPSVDSERRSVFRESIT